MGEQRTFASEAWQRKGKVTRRERFLAEMNAVIPWGRLCGLIEPHYPKAGRGRQPLGLETMLRIYCLQQWFNLSDPQAEDSPYDSESMRRFARIELGEDVVPDETTILRFRHRLEQPHLNGAMFEAITGLLTEKAAAARGRDDRGRDDHRGAELDEERHGDAGPGDAAGTHGPDLALRDEAAHRDGPPGRGASRDGDPRGHARPTGPTGARRRRGG